MAREGKLILPAPEDTVEFTTLIVDLPVSEAPSKMVGRPEIVLGPGTIHLGEGASIVRKDGRIEQLEKLVAGFNHAGFGPKSETPIPTSSSWHWKTWKWP